MSLLQCASVTALVFAARTPPPPAPPPPPPADNGSADNVQDVAGVVAADVVNPDLAQEAPLPPWVSTSGGMPEDKPLEEIEAEASERDELDDKIANSKKLAITGFAAFGVGLAAVLVGGGLWSFSRSRLGDLENEDGVLPLSDKRTQLVRTGVASEWTMAAGFGVSTVGAIIGTVGVRRLKKHREVKRKTIGFSVSPGLAGATAVVGGRF